MSRGWETPMRSSSETGAGVTGVAGRLNALSLQSGAARGRPGARVAGFEGLPVRREPVWRLEGRWAATRIERTTGDDESLASATASGSGAS